MNGLDSAATATKLSQRSQTVCLLYDLPAASGERASISAFNLISLAASTRITSYSHNYPVFSV